jgi:hypothetical protein
MHFVQRGVRLHMQCLQNQKASFQPFDHLRMGHRVIPHSANRNIAFRKTEHSVPQSGMHADFSRTRDRAVREWHV